MNSLPPVSLPGDQAAHPGVNFRSKTGCCFSRKDRSRLSRKERGSRKGTAQGERLGPRQALGGSWPAVASSPLHGSLLTHPRFSVPGIRKEQRGLLGVGDIKAGFWSPGLLLRASDGSVMG